MRQNHTMVTEVDGVEEGLLSKEGIIILFGIAAFREFEKTPRKRTRAGLNILFHKAKENGYTEKDIFLRAFKTFPGSPDDRMNAGDKLGGYLEMEDVLMAFDYMHGIS